MKYDDTNRGALFRNADKTDDRHADYKGSLNAEGAEFWVDGWLNTSSKGTKYLRLKLKPKQAAAEKAKPDFDDAVPF